MTPTQTQTKPAATMNKAVEQPLELALLKDAKTQVRYAPFQSDSEIALSVNLIQTMIAVPAKDRDGNELLPDPRQCIKFIALNRARKLNPFEGDSFMIPFWNKSLNRHEWSLITAHNAFLKRAEVHPDYNGKESGVIVFDEESGTIEELQGDFVPPGRTLLGGWCKVHYKTKAHPEYQRLKLETYAKGFGNWTFDAAGMICKCSEAAALRSAFPNTMAGMYLREEMGNGELAETTPQPMARPLFSTPAKPPEMPQDEKQGIQTPPPAPKPQEGGKAEAPSIPKPSDQAVNVVKSLLKASKIKESELLGFLADIGIADPGCSNLEELDLASETAMGLIAEQWDDFRKRVLEARANPMPE
jgi:phage recombination protein Bet